MRRIDPVVRPTASKDARAKLPARTPKLPARTPKLPARPAKLPARTATPPAPPGSIVISHPKPATWRTLLVKFVALYRKPDDPVAFEKWYLEQHLPILKRYPDVEHMHIERITGSPRGESEFYWMFEAVYKDKDTMMKSLMSEPGMESSQDARASGFGGLMAAFFTESI
jgi:uncharacterized protein (TIGR02118 family)